MTNSRQRVTIKDEIIRKLEENSLHEFFDYSMRPFWILCSRANQIYHLLTYCEIHEMIEKYKHEVKLSQNESQGYPCNSNIVTHSIHI